MAALGIETGRFENLALNERICPFCQAVEDEKHVLLDCEMYSDFRNEMFQTVLIHDFFF